MFPVLLGDVCHGIQNVYFVLCRLCNITDPHSVLRPIVYVAVRKHNVYERDIDKFTKFIVYILVSANEL